MRVHGSHVAETLIVSRFVRRVSMVGVSGSGKSTVGKELARRLAVPHVELDAIFHQPGWTPLPAEQFRWRVTAIASGDGWVIDGNQRCAATGLAARGQRGVAGPAPAYGDAPDHLAVSLPGRWPG
jgi:hypothetical protein